MASSRILGHEVIYYGGRWRKPGTGEIIDMETALCVKCHQPATATGQDPCIPNLPGVIAACCGHGVEPGFVMFSDGRTIRGEFTVESPNTQSGEPNARIS